jgi:hypothetical protein
MRDSFTLKKWFFLGLAVLLIGGCEASGEPSSSPASNPPDAKKSASESDQKTDRAKPPREVVHFLPDWQKGTPKKGADGNPVDKFGLPLVITLELPEVPEEIRKPSPKNSGSSGS